MGIDLGSGYTGFQCHSHIAQVGGEKQIGMKRFQIAPRRLATGETATHDGQPIVLC